MHMMIDIETLGMAPDGVILSIGACLFELEHQVDPLANRIIHCLHVAVNVEDCVRQGMKLEGQTCSWWLNENAETLGKILAIPNVTLAKALFKLSNCYADWENLEGVWCSSPAFDFAILKYAYSLVDIQVPWTHRQERCSRTVNALGLEFGGIPEIQREGIQHLADDDAMYQANVLQETWKHIKACC